MHHHPLGATGPNVSAIGLGCMGMSGMYGPADRAESIATIHAALDAGVTLLDTGDFYGMGHNEMLIGEALKGRRRDAAMHQRQVRRAARPGRRLGRLRRAPGGGEELRSPTRCNGSASTTSTSTARRASTPTVPIEDTIGAIAEMVEGRLRARTSACPRSAPRPSAAPHAVHPIADLQIEYSLISRGIEDGILPTCRELGIAVTAYGVLSRGLISGHWRAGRRGDGRLPRLQPALPGRQRATQPGAGGERCAPSPSARGVSVAQVAIAWVVAQGEDIVPVIGARRRERLAEALGALDVTLSARRSRRHRAGGAEGCRCRRALSAAGDGASGQRNETLSDARKSRLPVTPPDGSILRMGQSSDGLLNRSQNCAWLRAKILVGRLDVRRPDARRRATASAGHRGCARASAIRSASPVPMIASACSKSVISPTATTGMPDRLLHRARQRHLIARADRDLLGAASSPPLETWMAAQPRASSAWAKATVCSMSQPPCAQSVPETRMVTGLLGGKGGAHRVEHLQREAHPVLEASRHIRRRAGSTAARGTGAADSHARRAAGSRRCRAARRGGPRRRKPSRMRAQPVAVQRRRARSRPPRTAAADGATVCQPLALVRRDLLAALPGQLGRRLAAGMGELDRDRHVATSGACLPAPAPHRRLGRVVIQPDVAIGDPALGRDGGRLDGQQRRAGQRQMAEMDQVPVGHAAVLRRILAHRRDDDAVGESARADLHRRKELGRAHGDLHIPCSLTRAHDDDRVP